MWKKIKKNWFFILIFLAVAGSIILKDMYLPTAVVSIPDTQVAFATDQRILEQTWQPTVKRLSEVSIPYTVEGSFAANLCMRFVSDDGQKLFAQVEEAYQFTDGEQGTLQFPVDVFSVEPGTRYRIQLVYENVEGIGKLLFPAGSNYMGCSIDGAACDLAAAFRFVFVKYSRIFWLVMTFFPFLSFSLLFMTAWRRKWEEVIGLAFLASSLLLYVSGLFGSLEYGIVALYILSVVSIAAAMYLYDRRNMTVSDVLSPAVPVYGLLFLLVILNNRNTWFGAWDEYSHWGTAVKDMYYYNAFPAHMGSTVMLIRYPPFSALIEYFFTYNNGLFSIDLLYIGFQMMLVSCLILLCKAAAKGKVRYLLPAVLIIFTLPVSFFGAVFNDISADPLLAVLLAYVFICYYSEKMSLFNMLRIICGVSALTLTKEAGLALAGLACLVMLLDTCWKGVKEKNIVGKRMAWQFLPFLATGGSFISWQLYLRTALNRTGAGNGAAGINSFADSSDLSVGGILNLFTGNGQEYQYRAVKNFFEELFREDTFALAGFPCSFAGLLVSVLIIALLLSFVDFLTDIRKRLILFGMLSALMGMAYALSLLFLCLFAFPASEAVDPGIERYLGAWAGGVVLALAGLFLLRAAEAKNREDVQKGWKYILVMCGILIIIVPIQDYYTKNRDYQITEDMVYGFDDADEVLRSFADKGERIYFVCNNAENIANYMFRTAVCPVNVSLGEYNLFASEKKYQEMKEYYRAQNEEEIGSPTILSPDIWKERLKQYQYVFLMHPNEVFQESFGELFEDSDTIGDGTFYQVRTDSGELSLHYIGRVGMKWFLEYDSLMISFAIGG